MAVLICPNCGEQINNNEQNRNYSIEFVEKQVAYWENILDELSSAQYEKEREEKPQIFLKQIYGLIITQKNFMRVKLSKDTYIIALIDKICSLDTGVVILENVFSHTHYGEISLIIRKSSPYEYYVGYTVLMSDLKKMSGEYLPAKMESTRLQTLAQLFELLSEAFDRRKCN